MQELIDRFISDGLTEVQANSSIETINKWLDEKYPVAGVLLNAWIKSNSSESALKN